MRCRMRIGELVITDAFPSVRIRMRLSSPRPNVRQLTRAPILDIVGRFATLNRFLEAPDNFLRGKTDNKGWRRSFVASG